MKPRHYLGASLAVLFTATTAAADEPMGLQGITVGGDWLGAATEEDVKTYPGARTVVDDTELKRSGARNLEDALRRVPGVRVDDETGLGILPNIGVRGLNPLRSERAMVLMDGVPLALAPYTGTGLSLFPVTLETVDRVDIVRGGAAVRYGPNNVGGVIDIISQPIPRRPTYTAKQQLTIAEESGNILSDSYLRAGGWLSDDLGLQLQLNRLGGEAFRERSDTELYNIVADAEWLASEISKLEGRIQYYTVESQLPGALTPQAYAADRMQSQRPFDAFEGDTLRASLTYTQLVGEGGELEWVNFGHTSSRQFTFGQTNLSPAVIGTSISTSPRDFLTFGTEPRYIWRTELAGIGHKLTIGGRYVRENVDFVVDRLTLATGAIAPVRDWRFETDAYAAYLSDTLSLFGDRLEITPGLRYERVSTDFVDQIGGTAAVNKAQELLPGLTVGYKASEQLFLFGNMNRSLRPPQVAQVTRGGDVGAEVGTNYEIGARVTPLPGLDASATLFRIDFEDQIEFDRVTGLFRNLGETRHQGIEVAANWRPAALPGLTLKGSYTFVDAEQLTGQFAGNAVPFAAEHQLGVSANYAFDPFNLNINGFYQSASFSDAANTTTETADGGAGEMPAYWLWNVQLTRDFAVDGRALTAALAVNNIFDEDAYFRGIDTSPIGRVPLPGRAYMLSLKAQF